MNSPAPNDLAFPHLFKHEKSEYFILSADWQLIDPEVGALTLLLQSHNGYHYVTHRIMDWDKDQNTGKLYFVLDDLHYVQIQTKVQSHQWPIPSVSKDQDIQDIAAEIEHFTGISS